MIVYAADTLNANREWLKNSYRERRYRRLILAETRHGTVPKQNTVVVQWYLWPRSQGFFAIAGSSASATHCRSKIVFGAVLKVTHC